LLNYFSQLLFIGEWLSEPNIFFAEGALALKRLSLPFYQDADTPTPLLPPVNVFFQGDGPSSFPSNPFHFFPLKGP